ncbi:MAG TPA: helix-turn-helix transcriptional regulator [Polyangiaceae bacterium]|jgi:transcriptional regulator with XRE-family HTH domain|nr:helix-turn-helix transcriptional regulator [Polyangiaceae bacterium]
MPRREEADPRALAIGQRIRQLREDAGLNKEQLAFEADFSKGHLSSLERGLVMPTVGSLERLADVLGVLVIDLINDPSKGDRERLIDLSRFISSGALRKLVREMAGAAPKRRPPR